MRGRRAQLVAALAAALLLLGLGRTSAAPETSAALTATTVGHDAAAVVVAAGGARLSATDPGTRLPVVVATARELPAPPRARAVTDGEHRTPAPHLAASTGDRAPPALS